jgi:hypothetical protein
LEEQDRESHPDSFSSKCSLECFTVRLEGHEEGAKKVWPGSRDPGSSPMANRELEIGLKYFFVPFVYFVVIL